MAVKERVLSPGDGPDLEMSPSATVFFSPDTCLPRGQVFLRESLEQKLEKRREEEINRAAMVIRAHILGYLAR